MRRCLRRLLLGMLAVALAAVAAQAAEVERITVAELNSRLDAGETIVFLDTRNDYAWQHSEQMIPGARRVHDNPSFTQVLDELPKVTAIVTYCT